MGRRLFVGNLPYEVGEAELQELFGRVGPVESVNIVRDNPPGLKVLPVFNASFK